MKFWVPVVCGLLVGPAVLAGQAHGQTLNEALAAAYANSPVLRAERAGLRATDEQVPQALSNWRPTIDVTGDIERSDTFGNKRTFGSKDQIRTPRGVALNITQPVFRGLRTLAATREAENTVKAARARLLSTEQDVLLDAATAYMDVVRDQAVLDLNIGNEKVLRRQLEAARDRFEVGEVTRTDVSQAEARLAGATAERIRGEGDLVGSRAVYRNVVGEAPRKLTAPAPLGGLPRDREAAFALARDDHPDVVSALFDERAALDRVKGVGGELLPRVSLNAKVRRDFETIATKSRFEEQSIGATLTMPLYQSGAVYSRLREAKQTVGQERIEITQARRDVVQGVTQAWEALQTAQARIVSFTVQVRANDIALEGVKRESEVGARTVLDILDAEQELLGANVDLVGAQRDEIVAAFELKAAVGRLSARQLNLPVDFYDPERHYREVRDKWLGGSSTGQAEEMDTGAARSGYK
jgi:outer membrane protein